MWLKSVFFSIFLSVYHSHGAVLLWCNHKIEISPLKSFTDETLDGLIQDLGYPEVTLYKTHAALLPEFNNYLKGYYTAYNPNGDVSVENATEILDKEEINDLHLDQKRQNNNILSVLVIPNNRNKREILQTNNETDISSGATKGPVSYKGKLVGDPGNVYGLLYSSQPLLLKIDNNSITLGSSKQDTMFLDTVQKDSYTRFTIKVPADEEKDLYTLRFIYSWSPSNYWTLISVTITHVSKNYNFTLVNTMEPITAPAHFSYHCSGETVFSDPKNNVMLYVYDLQTQIDSTNNQFSDAYDCVNFTTAPILSGLFVSSLLGIGLIIALIAISDIKTMDKFDNYKTKQLVVTVSE